MGPTGSWKKKTFQEILALSNIFSGSKLGPEMDENCKFACLPFDSKFNLLKDFSNTVFALLEGYLRSKLTPDIYLNKVFYLTKSWGVKMSLKTSFLAQFR